jgi:hypothetical protein
MRARTLDLPGFNALQLWAGFFLFVKFLGYPLALTGRFYQIYENKTDFLIAVKFALII